MKSKLNIIIIIIFSCFFSCKKNGQKTDIKITKNISSKSNVSKDTLFVLLEKAKKVDTLEFNNSNPFLYIKSGKLFSKYEKNAIIINCPTDSTFNILFFTKKNEKWIKDDEFKNLNFNPLQFYLDFKDYNFDGQKDIYIQRSASNGWSLSRGYLFTIDTITKKITEHKETRDLSNMTPDIEKKVIYTDELDFSGKERKVNCRINKWKNGKLISCGIDKTKENKY